MPVLMALRRPFVSRDRPFVTICEAMMPLNTEPALLPIPDRVFRNSLSSPVILIFTLSAMLLTSLYASKFHQPRRISRILPLLSFFSIARTCRSSSFSGASAPVSASSFSVWRSVSISSALWLNAPATPA